MYRNSAIFEYWIRPPPARPQYVDMLNRNIGYADFFELENQDLDFLCRRASFDDDLSTNGHHRSSNIEIDTTKKCKDPVAVIHFTFFTCSLFSIFFLRLSYFIIRYECGTVDNDQRHADCCSSSSTCTSSSYVLRSLASGTLQHILYLSHCGCCWPEAPNEWQKRRKTEIMQGLLNCWRPPLFIRSTIHYFHSVYISINMNS